MQKHLLKSRICRKPLALSMVHKRHSVVTMHLTANTWTVSYCKGFPKTQLTYVQCSSFSITFHIKIALRIFKNRIWGTSSVYGRKKKKRYPSMYRVQKHYTYHTILLQHIKLGGSITTNLMCRNIYKKVQKYMCIHKMQQLFSELLLQELRYTVSTEFLRNWSYKIKYELRNIWSSLSQLSFYAYIVHNGTKK